MMPAYAARLVSQGVAPPSLIRDGADLTGLSILERLGEVWSEFPLIDVHDGTIGSACSVGESEALTSCEQRRRVHLRRCPSCSQDCHAIGALASEQHECVPAIKEQSEAVGQCRRRRRGLTELTIEIV
jgi:hypothetical protein